MTVNTLGASLRPRRIAHLGLAAAGAMALVVLSAGYASASPPLDAVDDVATPLTTGGTATAPLLANDIGQDGNPADCQDVNLAVKNCDFDPASVTQQGTNGSFQINTASGDGTYTTFLAPSDPGYAAVAAGAPCTGLLDTFQYTLIGYDPDVDVIPTVLSPLHSGFTGPLALPVPDSTDTATVTVLAGTATRTPGAVDDTASTKRAVAVSGNLLVNDCDQTNTTPASPQNVVASLATPPSHGKAVVNPDGSATYTPNAPFVGTDSFTYTITTVDAGAPRTSTATVTITVAPNPPPGLPNTGTNVVPIGLAGAALLLLGSGLLVLARRRRTEIS